MVELGPNPQLEPRPDLNAPRWVALANVLGNRHPHLGEDEIIDMVNQFIDDDLAARTAEWTARRDEHQFPPSRTPTPPPLPPLPPPPPPAPLPPQPSALQHRESTACDLPEIIPGRAISGRDVVRIHPFAADKLRKFKYVGLWYFTEAALEEAAKLPQSEGAAIYLDTDTMKLRNGIKEAKNYKRDIDLTWAEWTFAVSGYLTAMEDHNWPRAYLDMYSQFFANVQHHPIRRADRALGQKILIDYLHHARDEFHIRAAAKIPCDLATISATLLEDAKARVRNEEATRCVKFASPNSDQRG